MWPLTLIFLFAMSAAPQQNDPAPQSDLFAKSRRQLTLDAQRMREGRIAEDNSNVCFTIRSYHFRRQDGLAPVPAGVTTCTPAIDVRQRRVSKPPRVLYVPLGMQ